MACQGISKSGVMGMGSFGLVSQEDTMRSLPYTV